MHFIKESTLDSPVDGAIREIAAYVLKDEKASLQQVWELVNSNREYSQTDSKKGLATARERIIERSNFIKKLMKDIRCKG